MNKLTLKWFILNINLWFYILQFALHVLPGIKHWLTVHMMSSSTQHIQKLIPVLWSTACTSQMLLHTLTQGYVSRNAAVVVGVAPMFKEPSSCLLVLHTTIQDNVVQKKILLKRTTRNFLLILAPPLDWSRSDTRACKIFACVCFCFGSEWKRHQTIDGTKLCFIISDFERLVLVIWRLQSKVNFDRYRSCS